MSKTMNTSTVCTYRITLQDISHRTYFTPPKEHERQILKSKSWYTHTWRIGIFSVPPSTLQRRNVDRVLGSTDVSKYHALFHYIFWPNGVGVLRCLLIGSMIGPRHLPGRFSFSSPAHIWDSKDLGIPTHLFSRMGLTEQHRQAEIGRAFKRKLYVTWQTMSTAETKQREVRIVQLQPAIDWPLVWGPSPQRNNAWLSLISMYMAIHDVITTNVRLHWIRLMETDNCTYCRRQYTIVNRRTVWGWGGGFRDGPACG